MLPAFILSLVCQIMVKSTFSKYSKIENGKRITGADAAKTVLRNGDGITPVMGVDVTRVSGELTDHFDPKANVIRLSDPVYGKASIAAVGVAAHEAGHAVQHATEYAMIKVRTSIIPVCNIGARFAPYLIILGLLLGYGANGESGIANILFVTGIILFSTVALFQLVTLPVEFNASKRALKAIDDSGMLSSEELAGAKKVLTAAALTYVAALFQSLMQIFYYISLANRRKD